MNLVKNAISWFEIPVLDFDRAKKFYSAIFNYEMPEMEMGPFQMGILPHDQEGQGVGGAIIFGEGYHPAGANGARVYLNTGDDLNVVLERVPAAGGIITMAKTEIAPDMGFMAFFDDLEGNNVGLYSSK
jgi:predicted enzyme related to lactoylglutathione lyase